MIKSKKFIPLALVFSMIMATSVPAFAAEPTETNVTVSTNAAGETVYTQTLDMNDIVVPYASSSSKTVTASSSLGLALRAGESGSGVPVNFRFSSLPSGAVVRSIQIKPGTGVINSNKNMLGAILLTSITITSPIGKTASLTWNAREMTDNSKFFNTKASGTWTAYVTGRNLTNPVGDPMWDALRAGSLSYKSAEMTISYVVE